jgi:hypothetical protein
MIRIARVVFSAMLLLLVGCTAIPNLPTANTATPTVTILVPPTALPTATQSPVTPIAVVAKGSPENPFRIRIIQSDLNSSTILKEIIEEAAQQMGIALLVDVHSADGAYALAQMQDTAVSVDAWIGTDYDVAQLDQYNAIAPGNAAATPQMFPFVAESIATHPQLAVYPLAAKNYLIGISNAELLPELPESTASLMTIDRRTLGRTRYDMAFAWAEGRWFDALVTLLDPAATIPAPTQPPNPEALQQALTSLTELRTLGPREATSYQEAVTDFVNWRVQFTLDGDAAIRRYEQYSQTLSLAYAPAPLYSITETPLSPPIDVVSIILAPSADVPSSAQLSEFITFLQSNTVQAALITRLHWVPLTPHVFSQIDITNNPANTVVQSIAPTLRAQSYSAATLCRWDAYEAVLPFVLLREQSVAAGEAAMSNAIQACLQP